MKRNFNYTERKRILLHDVSVSATPLGATHVLDATLLLGDYSFEPRSRVFVEAYRNMEMMRFDFGAPSSPEPPTDRRLTRFSSLEGVRIRVRVVSTDSRTAGVVLGEATRVPLQDRSRGQRNRRSLLPIEPRDLQGELYRLELDEGPLLLVAPELGGDWHSVARSPLFQALVFPDVLRTTLLLLREKGWKEATEDPSSWEADWIRLAEGIPGFVEPAAGVDKEHWVDQIVEAFCRSRRLVESFGKAWSEATSN